MTEAERNLLIGLAQALTSRPGPKLDGLLDAVLSEGKTKEFLRSYIERTTAPAEKG